MDHSLLKHPATLIWLLLMLATALSWWLGVGGIATESSVMALAASLMIIAFIKVRFVIRYFMEVRHAPLALRLICDGWLVLICGAILVLYWMSPSV